MGPSRVHQQVLSLPVNASISTRHYADIAQTMDMCPYISCKHGNATTSKNQQACSGACNLVSQCDSMIRLQHLSVTTCQRVSVTHASAPASQHVSVTPHKDISVKARITSAYPHGNLSARQRYTAQYAAYLQLCDELKVIRNFHRKLIQKQPPPEPAPAPARELAPHETCCIGTCPLTCPRTCSGTCSETSPKQTFSELALEPAPELAPVLRMRRVF